jgi:hypothetical protein
MESCSVKILIFCIAATILYALFYSTFSAAEAVQHTNSSINLAGVLAAIHIFASIGLAGAFTEKIT